MQGVTGSSPVSPTISLPRTAQPAEGPSPCRRCAGRTIIAAIPQGVDAGMTLLELARKEGKAKVAVPARGGGAVVDLARPLPDGAKVDWVLPSDPDGAEILRHSTAHVMAAAVKELFPKAMITIGPAIENGVYYDFGVGAPVPRGSRTRRTSSPISPMRRFPSTGWAISSTCAAGLTCRPRAGWVRFT